MNKQYNILFAIADDASHFGINDSSFVQTPCIKKLANEGCVFENAFTTNPKCAPSRCSILTGLHTWRLREGCDHFGYFPDNVTVFPDVLESNGYKIGYTGKGWEPGDYRRCKRTRNPAGNNYSDLKCNPPKGSSISDCDYAANFEQFINEKKENKPFFFWYGGHEPHRPYTFKEGGVFNVKDSQIPKYLPNCEDVKQDFCDYAFEIKYFDYHLEKMVDLLKKQDLLKDTIIVVTSDNGAPFPRIKGQMYEDDFHLPLVIYNGDNLKMPNNKKVNSIVSFVDFFPTFLEVANIKYDQGLDGKSLIPLFFEDKREENYALMGKERHDVGREGDKGYPVRCLRDENYLLIWNLKPNRWPAGNPETNYTNCDSSPTKDKILELKDEGNDYYYNLSFNKRPEFEFYDIKNDSECLHNLIDTQDHFDLIKKMKNLLIKKLIETKDPRMFNAGEEFDTYEYVGEDNHSWANYIKGTWSKQNF